VVGSHPASPANDCNAARFTSRALLNVLAVPVFERFSPITTTTKTPKHALYMIFIAFDLMVNKYKLN